MQEEPRLCLFIFYVMSLHLVCAMCYGRNTLTRDAFLRASKAFGLNFEFPALLEGVNNNKLPLVLRSSLLQVRATHHLFCVTTGSMHRMSRLDYCCVGAFLERLLDC